MADIIERLKAFKVAKIDENDRAFEYHPSIFDEAAAKIASLTASLETLAADVLKGNEVQARLTAERDAARKDLGEIEKIANIAPADDRFGSMAERMNKVWLLARGHQQAQRK